jgi:hypothetical protein
MIHNQINLSKSVPCPSPDTPKEKTLKPITLTLILLMWRI